MLSKQPFTWKFISTKKLANTILAFAMLGIAPGDPALARDRDARPTFCTRTSNAAFLACRHDVTDDYWIAIGNCNNVSAPDERTQCAKEAKSALKDGTSECREQRDARLEVCDAVGETPYDPQINPAMFVDPAEIGKSVAPNPYFPLVRGQRLIYKGGSETDTTTVTSDTREIQGVQCATVHDVVEDDGEVVEDTLDWYAQDIYGNVWYFGEIAQSFEGGVLANIDGSWTAGVENAKAGIIMKANPVVGETYRQEFSLGNAEDAAEVLDLNGSAVVPAASCNGDCLVTRDFTPIEPGVNEHKYYKPGIGVILETNPDTGERNELVEITIAP